MPGDMFVLAAHHAMTFFHVLREVRLGEEHMVGEARKGHVTEPNARVGSDGTLATDSGRDGADALVRPACSPLRVCLTSHPMVRAPLSRGG